MSDTAKPVDGVSGDLADDLAYVRSLAEEGAHAPLVAGRFFVLWGALMSAASLFVYLNAINVLPFGAPGMIAPWIVGGLIGWVASFVTGRQIWRKPGAATLGNKTATSVWLSVGILMSVFWLVLFVAHARYESIGVPPYFLFGLMFPVGFGVYGVAFFATATAARQGWMRAFAALSWAMMGVTMLTLSSPWQFLIGAIGLLVCAVAPGILLMRREPSDLV